MSLIVAGTFAERMDRRMFVDPSRTKNLVIAGANR